METNRLEYRIWGEGLDEPSEIMRELGSIADRRGGDEVYLPLTGNYRINPKIRGGVVDVKTLVEILDGFERWSPVTAAALPVSGDWIDGEFRDALELGPITLERTHYDSEQFITEVISQFPEVDVVPLAKDRTIYDLGECIGEISDVAIGEVTVTTIAVESTNLVALRVLRGKLGLDRYENWSYPRAIHELSGRQPR